MEFVTVRTEAEALLLEANLIKRFRPRYNVLLRDDKSFPYILIARDHTAPQILKHRGARNRKGDYFGPFASAGAVNRTINMLERAFLLRSCSDPRVREPHAPLPAAPDQALLGALHRRDRPGGLRRAGRGGDRASSRARARTRARCTSASMQEAAASQDYEQAAKYRNRLWALAHVTADQNINPEGIEEADVFAAYQEGGQTCVQVFFFRAGQNWGNRAYFPRADKSLGPEEVLESFIAQFYDDKPVPRCIFLSHELPMQALLAEALSTKAERKVEDARAAAGYQDNHRRARHAECARSLGRRLAETSSQRILLEGLKERFGLARVPRRIEVYDNSHIQGASAVGAMIVAGPEGFVKNQYRKFNIKSADLAPGDDYAMMREVLARRFKRLVLDEAEAPKVAVSDPPGLIPLLDPSVMVSDPEGLTPVRPEGSDTHEMSSRIEQPQPPPIDRRGGSGLAFGVLRADAEGTPTISETELSMLEADAEADAREPDAASDEFPNRPDLVLIDGGRGQLAIAIQVLNELGVTGIPLVGVAKGPDRDAGREHFHFPGHDKPLHARAARSRVVFRPAPARRGAPLRHRHPPRQAQQGHRRQPARRDRRHRPDAQAGAARAFRLGQGRLPRQPRGYAGRRRHQRPDGASHLRLLPRAAGVTAGCIAALPDEFPWPRPNSVSIRTRSGYPDGIGDRRPPARSRRSAQ